MGDQPVILDESGEFFMTPLEDGGAFLSILTGRTLEQQLQGPPKPGQFPMTGVVISAEQRWRLGRWFLEGAPPEEWVRRPGEVTYQE